MSMPTSSSIVKSIMTQHLDEFLAFSERILRLEA